MCQFWAVPFLLIIAVCCRDVLGTVGAMGAIDCGTLEPLLPAEVMDRLEQECLDTVWVHTHPHTYEQTHPHNHTLKLILYTQGYTISNTKYILVHTNMYTVKAEEEFKFSTMDRV